MQLLTIFPMLQYDFMRHAFLAAVLIAPLFALLGTMEIAIGNLAEARRC